MESKICNTGPGIYEYQPFYLKSFEPGSYLSIRKGAPFRLVVAGATLQPDETTLKMCAVSSDEPCDPSSKTNCIYNYVDYFIRVEAPFQGYLSVIMNSVYGDVILADSDFDNASKFHFYREVRGDLRIAQNQPDGELLVFEARGVYNPITVRSPLHWNKAQMFSVEPSHS
ncbi:hypothetical protein BGW41_000703 [Actinomortierella wolfii]|nr:hypothetical protein BGW41_000703 [Actinomortierella wolfii]